MDGEDEIILYGELLKEHRLGSGECSAIACAIKRKYILAIDDVRAIKKAMQTDADLEIVSTEDIMVKLIQENVITVSDADTIKQTWEVNFKFALKFRSFKEII